MRAYNFMGVSLTALMLGLSQAHAAATVNCAPTAAASGPATVPAGTTMFTCGLIAAGVAQTYPAQSVTLPAFTLTGNVVAPTAFSISTPANGATETGSFVVTGVAGSNWTNIAAFDASWNKLDSTDVSPSKSNGAFSLNIDQLSTLATGSNTVHISAFSASTNAPGQPWAGTENDLSLAFNYQPGGGGVNGACGSANGVATSTKPTTGLCSAGTATAVSGTGPWTWSCNGSGSGGSNAACNAPLQTSGGQPVGNPAPGHTWTSTFDDEFTNESSLDTSKWACGPLGFVENNIPANGMSCSNVSFSGGYLQLSLPSASSGAQICSSDNSGDCPTLPSSGHSLKQGEFVEFKAYFPANGSGQIYNWSGVWVSGNPWPAGGEYDIAEVGAGALTTTYHNSSGSIGGNSGIAGNWGNAWHTFGFWRAANQGGTSYVYYDGVQVASYTANDTGVGQALLATNGYSTGSICNCGGPVLTGPSGNVNLAYVRAWRY